MRISEEYRRANRRLHESNSKYGTAAAKWGRKISSLVQETGCTTVLDYGCGKGLLAAALPELNIQEYDPAIPGKDEEPQPADLVVCLDVLEHVEPQCLDEVLTHIRSLAGKYAFLNIATRPAVKFLHDGRNAHLIVEPAEWWKQRVEPFFTIVEWSPRKLLAVNGLVRPR